MNNNSFILPLTFSALAVAVLLIDFDWFSNGDSGGSSVVVRFDAPVDSRLKDQASTITQSLKGSSHAADLAFFYKRLAELSSEIKSTDQLVALHRTAGRNLRSVAPEISDSSTGRAIDQMLMSTIDKIGREPKVLSESERQEIENTLYAVAWGCWQASNKSIAKNDLDAIANVASSTFRAVKSVPVVHQAETETVRRRQPGNLARGPPDHLTNGLIFETEEFKKIPRYRDSSSFRDSTGKVRLLYRATQHFYPSAFEDERQTTGDCTSHTARNAGDTARSVEILANAEPERWVARGATEPIYGHRGHTGEGMSIARAVEFLTDYGFAVRKPYDGIDLSTYNSNVGSRWGSSGPPESLLSQIKERRFLKARRIESIEDAREAIYNGYPMLVGSMASFADRRDENGFARKTGNNWAHAMAWVAVDDSIDPDGPCFLIVNSWGPDWITGPKGEYDIPDGSFWIRPDVAREMIGQKQAVAIGDFNGFKKLPLVDAGTDWLNELAGAKRDDLSPSFNGSAATAVGVAVALHPIDITRTNHAPRPPPEPRPDPETTWNEFKPAFERLKADQIDRLCIVITRDSCPPCHTQKQSLERLKKAGKLPRTTLSELEWNDARQYFPDLQPMTPQTILYRNPDRGHMKSGSMTDQQILQFLESN